MSKTEISAKVRVSANALVIRGDKILLGRRKKKGEGTWCSPGGHLEYGESIQEAARRELLEETGLVAEKISFLHVLNNLSSDGFHYVCMNFVVKSWKGEPSVTEPDMFSEWKWFPIDELPSPMLFGHDIIIEMMLNGQNYKDIQK